MVMQNGSLEYRTPHFSVVTTDEYEALWHAPGVTHTPHGICIDMAPVHECMSCANVMPRRKRGRRTPQRAERTLLLRDLPPELLVHAFQFLSLQDLCPSCLMVCLEWNVLATDNVIWHKFYRFHFPHGETLCRARPHTTLTRSYSPTLTNSHTLTLTTLSRSHTHSHHSHTLTTLTHTLSHAPSLPHLSPTRSHFIPHALNPGSLEEERNKEVESYYQECAKLFASDALLNPDGWVCMRNSDVATSEVFPTLGGALYESLPPLTNSHSSSPSSSFPSPGHCSLSSCQARRNPAACYEEARPIPDLQLIVRLCKGWNIYYQSYQLGGTLARITVRGASALKHTQMSLRCSELGSFDPANRASPNGTFIL